MTINDDNYIYMHAPPLLRVFHVCLSVFELSPPLSLPSIAANRGGAAKIGLQISPKMNWASGQKTAPS